MTDTPDGQQVEVRHEDARSRYVAVVDGRTLGSAYYRRDRDGRTVFTHTEVDGDAEGQGIGSTLVRRALDDVRAGGGRIVAQCPFVARFVEEHPEYGALT